MSATERAFDYNARETYQDYTVGERYERDRFSSAAGRYRLWRERRAVGRLLEAVPSGAHVLDCPCGTGRWWPVLQRRAGSIVGADLSEGMLEHAHRRAQAGTGSIEVVEADAERLPFADGTFDWAFSYALTKHLPRPVQYQVLVELARVARCGVICSFAFVNHLTYEVWRRRYRAWRAQGLDESIPLLAEEMVAMADRAGLELVDRERATTPLGVEYVCLLTKRAVS